VPFAAVECFEHARRVFGVPTEFMQLPGTTSLHVVLYERYDWESARLRCRLIHPRAHLVVIDDAAENTAIKNYLISVPSKH